MSEGELLGAPAGDLARRISSLSPEKQELLARGWLRRSDFAGVATAGRRTGPPPLSPAQEGLWFLCRQHPESPAYSIPVRFRCVAPIDAAVLQRCLDEIVRRHEILRTTYEERGGQCSVVAHAPQPLPLTVVDLRSAPAEEQEVAAGRFTDAEARRPFDLAEWPLLRVAVVHLSGRSWLFVNAHHMICDGWAAGVLAGEVLTLYDAYSAGCPSPLPEPPIQYADYAVWQRRQLGEGRWTSQLDYWLRQLDGALPARPLPTERLPAAGSPVRGAKYFVEFPRALGDALRELSRREHATLFMTLVAALVTVLFRHTGQGRIVVGTTRSNRDSAGLESLVGHFVNMLALRVHPAPELRFEELLAQVREVSLGAYANQDVPFERVLSALRLRGGLGPGAPIGVVFTLENAALPLHPTVERYERIDNGTAKFDLVVNITDRAGELSGWFEYDADRFSTPTIALVADHFHDVLEAVAAEPDLQLIDVPLRLQAPLVTRAGVNAEEFRFEER